MRYNHRNPNTGAEKQWRDNVSVSIEQAVKEFNSGEWVPTWAGAADIIRKNAEANSTPTAGQAEAVLRNYRQDHSPGRTAVPDGHEIDEVFEVASIREGDGASDSTKGLLVHPVKMYKLWGEIPTGSGIGSKVRIQGVVSASGRDENFGFFRGAEVSPAEPVAKNGDAYPWAEGGGEDLPF